MKKALQAHKLNVKLQEDNNLVVIHEESEHSAADASSQESVESGRSKDDQDGEEEGKDDPRERQELEQQAQIMQFKQIFGNADPAIYQEAMEMLGAEPLN